MRHAFHWRRPSLAILAAVMFLAGCQTNPATGRRQFNMMSTEEEIALGTEAMPQLIEEYGGRVRSQQLQEYVSGVGGRLAQHTEADGPGLPWEFTVLNSEVINAFALPGGKVFITRGLLERFDNEAQVAGVLGHEIGHVTAQHVDERVTQASLLQLGVSGTELLAGERGGLVQAVPLVVGVGGQGYLLKFGRDQESEADVLGVKYMARAEYDPHGMLEVLQVLQSASQGGAPPEFLSTHPHPDTRIRTVRGLLEGEYAYTQNNDQYKKHSGRFKRFASPYLSPSSSAARHAEPAPVHWCALCAANDGAGAGRWTLAPR